MTLLDKLRIHYVNSPSRIALEATKAFENCVNAGENNSIIGVDTETTSLHFKKGRCRLVQIGLPTQCLVVDLDIFRDTTGAVDWNHPILRPVYRLLAGGKPKVFQNAAFDLVFLRSSGVVVGGSIFDTYIASKIVNNGTGAPNGLDKIVHRVLDIELPKENQKADWTKDLTEEQVTYAARDASVLTYLVKPLTEKLKKSRVATSVTLWDVFALEMKALRPIAYMRWHGFPFSGDKAQQLREELLAESQRLEQAFLQNLDARIRGRHPEDESHWLPRNPDGTINNRPKATGRGAAKLPAGFNPRSQTQMVKKFLSAGILLPPKPPSSKTKPGELNHSLDQNLLSFLRPEYPLVDEYLTWKESVTAVSSIETLLKHLQPNGRIHGGYNQLGADTGRLSASDPNLQQVKRDKRFRDLFEAPEGYLFVAADFSQVELRVAAELSGEPAMIAAYLANRDLHTETAALMLGVSQDQVTPAQRTSAKIANFGLLYGAGAATLRRQAMAQYGVLFSLQEAKKIVQGFRSAYPQLHRWQEQEGNGTATAVYTRYGRRRILTGFNDKYTVRINTQVQGTAGDISKISMALLWDYLVTTPSDEAALIAMVHDEIILLVKESLTDVWSKRLGKCMQAAGQVVCKKVPIVAEVSTGKTWGACK